MNKLNSLFASACRVSSNLFKSRSTERGVSRGLTLVVALLLSLLLSGPTQALEPSTIVYEVELDSEVLGKATLGRIETTLSELNGRYSVTTQTKADGVAAMFRPSLAESCEFEIIDGKAQSQFYSGGNPEQTEYTVDFLWDDRKIQFIKIHEQETLDMPQGYLIDNCNMPFALSLLKEQTIDETIYIVDGKKTRIRGFQFQNRSRELLATKLGSLETVKIEFAREIKPERTLTLWLSKDHYYLPVKIQERRKSRTTTLYVRELTIEN